MQSDNKINGIEIVRLHHDFKSPKVDEDWVSWNSAQQ